MEKVELSIKEELAALKEKVLKMDLLLLELEEQLEQVKKDEITWKTF